MPFPASPFSGAALTQERASAIGLVAAIPAVVAYNKLTTDLGHLQQSFTAGITALGDRLVRDRKPHLRAEAAE
jgi:biopolymer transport protein TolQ